MTKDLDDNSVMQHASATTTSNTPAIASAPILKVQNLRILANNNVLVKDLSFDLYPKQALGIVGESGSGKSLSSLALLGLLAPNLTVQGTALLALPQAQLNSNTVNTIDSTQMPLQYLSLLEQDHIALQHIRGKRIAIIFQEPMTALNPLHTIYKQIAEAILCATPALNKAEVKQSVISLLEQVGILDGENRLNSYPHELSGGQRQRVMIAMALAQKPDIIIADEPTTALDVTLQSQILDLLQTLQQQHNMALILISHDLNVVRHYTQQVIVMQAGQVVEQGDTASIFNHPKQAYTQHLLDDNFGTALIPTADAKTLLQVENVAVKFPIKTGVFSKVTGFVHAVNPLSFNLKQGESIGIVGESGSGKTTLALALARLISSSGNIILDGIALNGLSEKQIRPLRSQFQMVFQDPFGSLNPRLTLAQIIGEGIERTVIDKTERYQRVAQVLATVELPEAFITRYPHELSGGQRQRVSLARALIMQPKLLILDEPTSALDRTTQRSLVQLLRKIQKTEGLSYLFISHDLAVVRALCQQILVLYQGDMLELQPTAQLYANPQTDYTRRLISAAQHHQ